MENIYSRENIARSRARADSIRRQVADGELELSWLVTADEIEKYADERAALATYSVPVDPADATNCEACQ